MGDEEVEAVCRVLKSGWIGLGEQTRQFENSFANYIGTKHAVAMNSCTAALHTSMHLLGIGEGDEVVVPTMSFVSTAHAVHYVGAKPIFADCEEDSLSIDPNDVKERITDRTKAVIAMHYGGRPASMDELRDVVPKHIPIVEDAAHACGGVYKERLCGTLGDMACFSFHAVKNLSAGDGGCLTTDNDEWASKAVRFRWLGINKDTWARVGRDKKYWWRYEIDEAGYKYHMNDINASIAFVQLTKLDKMNERRKQIANAYFDGLQCLVAKGHLQLPLGDDAEYGSSWHIFHIKCDRRDELSEFMRKNGINSGVHYCPIHLYEYYNGSKRNLPVSEKVFDRILSLPMYPDLTDDDVMRVVSIIRRFYK
jgi:perosamine synthetase